MSINKYHAKRYYGFASKHEFNVYQDLRALEVAKEISDLRTQVRHVLIPAFELCGEKFRELAYVSDFEWTDKDGNLHVADAKGYKTRLYLIKRKLMAFKNNILIEEL